MSRMSNEEAIAVIKKEAECVKRQGKTGECCRDNFGCGACDLVEKDINIFAAYFLAIEALKDRPHGEWMKEIIVEEPRKNKRAYARCTECGVLFNHYKFAVLHFFFCPICGSDMRKENQ